ncbi:lanthionine synthetase C family protein [Streptomyces cyaneofuscatus]|uniref:lanthionine synthetase C family protein n=1 Tax=Streptomyces cyaneofuscatus TaxID=66883 RepID=UPI0036476324
MGTAVTTPSKPSRAGASLLPTATPTTTRGPAQGGTNLPGPSRPQSASPRWAQSLAYGPPGEALAAFEYAQRGGDLQAAKVWAAATISVPINATPSANLFHGAPAISTALHAAGPHGFHSARNLLHDYIADLTRRRLTSAHNRIDAQHPSLPCEWDLTRGLSGIGAFLLEHQGDTPITREVLRYLVRLTEPLTIGQEVLQGWCAPNPVKHLSLPPSDYVHTGMARGIAGPLALLATAFRRGIRVPGHCEAIERVCAWLDLVRAGTAARPWWPQGIGRVSTELASLQDRPPPPSWSEGTPGVARALQLAGIALSNRQRQNLAETALLWCLCDPKQLATLPNGGIADGWAGLALTTWRAATDSPNHQLAQELPALLSTLTQHLQPGPQQGAPGLLHGTTGIELVLYTLTVDLPLTSRWDTCLLTAG